MDDQTLLTLTTEIVTAHVSNNTLGADQVPGLIQSVYGALSQAGQPTVFEEPAREPAVSVRSSVKPDAITCLECGRSMKMLKRHLATDHNLTPAEYRARWGLKPDYPIVAPNYAARRQELAVQIGLGRKPGGGRKANSAGKSGAERKPRNRKQPEVVTSS